MNILNRNALERELLKASLPLMSIEEKQALLAQIRQEMMQLCQESLKEQEEEERNEH